MKNKRLPLDLATRLKKIGFNSPCFHYFYVGDTGTNVDMEIGILPSKAKDFNADDLCVSSPTFSQVFDWFREEKYLLSWVYTPYGKGNGYFHEINNLSSYVIEGGFNSGQSELFETYPEAEEACIVRLIEIVENNELLAKKHGMKGQINELVNTCYQASVAGGWHHNVDGTKKERNKGEMIALIHSEISEALEGLRKDSMDDHLPHRKMEEVELADAIIRICDYAGMRGFDLGGAIVEKLEYNRNRADHKMENRSKEGGKKF